MNSENRLSALDGLRGVAILLVMGFHYFNSDPKLYPIGDALAWIPIFKYGFLGVELFFIISGFVIALTLEKCATPIEFFIRRLARIWPALLVCSIVTFICVRYSASPFSATKQQDVANFLPSLTLTPNALWTRLFPSVDLIDAVYWTLLVEARFYVIAAILFWALHKHRFVLNLVIFTYANVLIRAALQHLVPGSNVIYTAVLIPDFMPWFAAGAIFYDLHLKRLLPTRAAILLALMFVIVMRTSTFATADLSSIVISATGALFFVVFWVFATRPAAVSLLQARWLVFVGVCSYSIYLLHYGIGLVLISYLPAGSLPFGLFMMVAVGLALIAAGYANYLFIEQPGRRLVARLTQPTAKR
jgi:peptidoglycan/LPS O-acetylase OafA/YrhL